MMRVLVWKEWRGQWASALAVVLFAVALMVYVATLKNVPYDTVAAVAVCMSWVCGLVAGVQPIATETESGTLNWLDALAVPRRRLWGVKAGSAAVVALLQVAALIGIGYLFVQPQNSMIGDPLLPLAFALSGLSSGFLGSAVARSALSAFGWAIVVQVVVLLAVAVFELPLAPALGRHSTTQNVLMFVTLGIPLAVSARLFTRLDRLRRPAVWGEQSTSGRGWRSLLWLAWAQVRWVWWLVTLSGLVGAVYLPGVVPHLWPVFGLALGLLTGIVCFGADQPGGSYQFLGVQRVPPGRFWLVKMALCASALVAVIGWDFLYGYALGNTISQSDPWRLRQHWEKYDASLVLIGPVFGFAIGQFFGLVCRRGMMAVVLAVLLGCGAVAVWLPSLIFGGVYLWQWLLPPVVLIAATRLALWPWMSARLATLKPVIGLTAAAIISAASVAGGIAYRVAEVPVKSDPFDVAAFEASLPTPDENRAGRAIVQALGHFRDHSIAVDKRFHQRTLGEGENRYFTRVQEATREAEWPADLDLNAWFDATFEGDWLDELRAAVRLPYGLVDLGFQFQLYQAENRAGQLILSRAFHGIAQGQTERAFDDIALVLRLGRQLMNKANSSRFAHAEILEASLTLALPIWCSKTMDKPDFFRRVIGLLRAYESEQPQLGDVVKMDYVSARDYVPAQAEFSRTLNKTEAGLRSFAASAPWEGARNRAILMTWYAGRLRAAEATYPDALRRMTAAKLEPNPFNFRALAWMPPPGADAGARRTTRQMLALLDSSIWSFGMLPYDGSILFTNAAAGCVRRRSAQVQLALILYETQHGKAADSLSQLVPEYLPELPADPFGEGPFRYRVSHGEKVQWHRYYVEAESYRSVSAGQGILWSVGPDLQDDGGRVNEQVFWNFTDSAPGADILILVPTVSKP